MADDPAPGKRLRAARGRRLVRMGAALLLGAAGGYLFRTINSPLPFMLGSMTFCTIAALAKAPIASPIAIRPPMLTILGVMLGASFHPEILAGIGAWVPTMLGVLVYVSATGAACAYFLHRIAGFDLATAYFAGMPGGLAEMVIQSEEQGGDTRAVALIHSFRLFFVVMTLPLLVQTIEGVTLGPRSGGGISFLDVPASGYIWLVVTGVAGAALGTILRMPARYLLGPVVVSAAVHLLGWSDFRPPTELINMAQVVLGTVIGCRFIGGSIRMIGKMAMAGVATTVFLMLSTFGMAAALASYTDVPMVALILCYSPGGLAEMSLIALALGIEVPFVAAHHIARLLFVMGGAGAVFRRINRA